jgi:peptide/nickel transport system permease protein
MSEKLENGTSDSVFDTHVETMGMGAEIPEEALGEFGLAGAPEPEPLSQWQLFYRRFKRHKMAVASLFILLLLFSMCWGVKWITPFEPGQQDLASSVEAPSRTHYFGTGKLGEDYFTEVLHAGQTSLRIGMTVAIISTTIGTILGAIAGFYGGWVDQILMRVTDLFLILPALAILAVAQQRFGSSPVMVSYVLAAVFWMAIARIVRGQTLAIREKEFVEAARAVGASGPRIMFRHVLPNCIGPIVVNATLAIAVAIILESTLSFLGFGVDSSWGHLLQLAKGNYDDNTHLLYFPGLAILLTVLCVNALGDGLRDALDPHAKH